MLVASLLRATIGQPDQMRKIVIRDKSLVN